jgi:hypothetical protein
VAPAVTTFGGSQAACYGAPSDDGVNAYAGDRQSAHQPRTVPARLVNTLPLEAYTAMIDRTQITTVEPDHRDELSMRVMEYALALMALAAAILISPR